MTRRRDIGIVRETERSAYWRQMITEWETSGMTQVSFCQMRNLSPSSFYWWRSEINKRDRINAADHSSSEFCKISESNEFPFIRVSHPKAIDPNRSQERIEIILTSGHRICVPHDFPPETLQRVLDVLESGC